MTRRRGRGRRRRKNLFVVATEGERTEQLYFDALRAAHPPANSVLHVLPARKGRSSPRAVLKTLRQGSRRLGIAKGDRQWIVIDRDTWSLQELNEVIAECKKSGIMVALSNPCFELWLALHLEDHKSPPICSECCSLLERDLGTYQKNRYDAATLVGRIEHALHRGRTADTSKARIPQPPVSRMHKLVAAFLKL